MDDVNLSIRPYLMDCIVTQLICDNDTGAAESLC
jgi:hypothetical protein